MREHVSRIGITSKTLQCTPYSRKAGEESKKARMCRVTLYRVLPIVSIEAEKEFNVLNIVSMCARVIICSDTYTSQIGQ